MESLEDAKKRLWAEGYLVGIMSMSGCPMKPIYEDANGNVFKGKPKSGEHKFAALHTAGLYVGEIQIFLGPFLGETL